MTSAIQLMHNMMAAHAKAVIAYKEAGYEGKIGIVHSLESKYPYDKTKDEDVKAAKNEDRFLYPVFYSFSLVHL